LESYLYHIMIVHSDYFSIFRVLMIVGGKIASA
jgi:hypothetical protein